MKAEGNLGYYITDEAQSSNKSPGSVTIVKPRTLRLAGHVVRTGQTNLYRVLPMKPLGRPRRHLGQHSWLHPMPDHFIYGCHLSFRRLRFSPSAWSPRIFYNFYHYMKLYFNWQEFSKALFLVYTPQYKVNVIQFLERRNRFKTTFKCVCLCACGGGEGWISPYASSLFLSQEVSKTEMTMAPHCRVSEQWGRRPVQNRRVGDNDDCNESKTPPTADKNDAIEARKWRGLRLY